MAIASDYSETVPRPNTTTTDGDLTVAAALFHGMSDPSRLAILRHLTLGEHRVRDLTDHLGLAQSTVSAHLACLRDCGLVTSRPQGRASMFSLSHEPELMTLLSAAETLLAISGDRVALCPNFGVGTGGSLDPDRLQAHPESDAP